MPKSSIVDVVRVDERAKNQLTTLKRRTGIKNWNVLCRWALCVSLAEPSIPADQDIATLSNVEMSWSTFGGPAADIYAAILRARCDTDGIPPDPRHPRGAVPAPPAPWDHLPGGQRRHQDTQRHDRSRHQHLSCAPRLSLTPPPCTIPEGRILRRRAFPATPPASANAAERQWWSTAPTPSTAQIRFAISRIRYRRLVTDSRIVAISTILDLRTAPAITAGARKPPLFALRRT